MNDTLKVAGRIGAELGAAKAENEKLRGLLREVRVLLANSSYKISGTAAFLSSIDNALSQQPEPPDTFTAVDMATAAAQGFRDGQAAVEPAPAQDEQSPEQMLSREQIENIARKVHGDCIRLPGATYQHAAEAAVMYTLERIARRQGAEPECGNCFEGKSNMDHVCRKCGGSGKAEQAQAQDERQAFEAWMVEVEGARIRPRFDRVTAGPFADEYRDGRIQGAWNVWQARAARPAQTEQQPVVIPPMVEFDDMVNRLFELDADARKYCARHWLLSMWKATLNRVCELNAAPIAQTAPQPEPVAWVAADTLHSPHPGCVSSLAYVSQVDKDRGREYVPLYAAPVPNQQTEQQPVAINPDPPELMIRWHESPESVHRAMWESVAIREGMTYDELLAEGVTCGFDESGNEVEMEAGADIEGMRMQGCWAFVDTLNSCIHAWAAPDTDRGLVLHMLAHEISHATGTPHPDGFQEEMRAEQFGRVAAAAYRMLLDKDRPQCTAPACGCADAYCMAWPDEAAPIAQTALSAVTAERDRLQSQLAETQANDRTAMGYLHDVRQLVGGSDFPEMVRNVARMVDALPGCVELIEALSPIEGDVLRKARAAMAAKEA